MVAKKLRNIVIGWFRKIFNKKENLAKSRLKKCAECPYKVKLLGQDVCNLCGCVLDAKARVEEEQCYDNRW